MSQSVVTKTPQDALQELAARVKARRLALNLSQEGLATRAGVSTGTIKRFEKIGQISVDSLLAIAFVLGSSDDFDNLFKPRKAIPVDDPNEAAHAPQRGRIK